MRVFYCLFVILLFSCSDDSPDTIVDCAPVIIETDIFNSDKNFDVQILDFTLVDDCLEVSLGFSGCDDNHEIDMVSDGLIAESLPPQITFDFLDKNPQDCEAYFTVERSFDLSPIKALYDGEIIVRFRGKDGFVTYSP